MNYFKLINGDEFIGVATPENLRRYQTKHNVMLLADLDSAQYIELNDLLYRDTWFEPVTTDRYDYTEVTISVIEEEEYVVLLTAVESGETITVESEADTANDAIETTEESEETDVTVEYVRTSKISEMSTACSNAIISGFDIVLSDGATHHFSLTTQDQINLLSLASQSVEINGESYIPYHADGELCTWFSLEDYNAITGSAANLKIYHTTYFNSLKYYINSLETISEIGTVYYGIEIPEEYQSEILVALLASE